MEVVNIPVIVVVNALPEQLLALTVVVATVIVVSAITTPHCPFNGVQSLEMDPAFSLMYPFPEASVVITMLLATPEEDVPPPRVRLWVVAPNPTKAPVLVTLQPTPLASACHGIAADPLAVVACHRAPVPVLFTPSVSFIKSLEPVPVFQVQVEVLAPIVRDRLPAGLVRPDQEEEPPPPPTAVITPPEIVIVVPSGFTHPNCPVVAVVQENTPLVFVMVVPSGFTSPKVLEVVIGTSALMLDPDT